MKDLYKDFPTPWRVDGEFVRASNGAVVYCNQQYYPWSDLSPDQWQEVCQIVNTWFEDPPIGN